MLTSFMKWMSWKNDRFAFKIRLGSIYAFPNDGWREVINKEDFYFRQLSISFL